MRKSLLLVLILVVAVAIPATAMARAEWTGAVDSTWSYSAQSGNWTSDPDASGYKTEDVRITSGSWGGANPANWPVITAADSVVYGNAALRDSSQTTQTGGYVRWMNGSANQAWSLYNNDWWYDGAPGAGANFNGPATFTMTGGDHIVDGNAGVGYDGLNDENPGLLNIWGDGTFQIDNNTWGDSAGLRLAPDSLIDIREDGRLKANISVSTGLQATIDGYIASGLIVNGSGGGLQTEISGDYYIVSAVVPEPGTLLLLCLGLGSLALIRRK